MLLRFSTNSLTKLKFSSAANKVKLSLHSSSVPLPLSLTTTSLSISSSCNQPKLKLAEIGTGTGTRIESGTGGAREHQFWGIPNSSETNAIIGWLGRAGLGWDDWVTWWRNHQAATTNKAQPHQLSTRFAAASASTQTQKCQSNYLLERWNLLRHVS